MKLKLSAVLLSAVAVLCASLLALTGTITFGNVTATNGTAQQTEKYVFFATSTDQTVFSTTTTALSTSITPWFDSNGRKDNGYFVIDGAERVTFYFSREWGAGNAGSSLFDVDVSYDGVTWHDYGYLKSATSSATYASVSLVGTTTSIVSLDLVSNHFYAVRCNVTETTDGEHFCQAHADY
jgi:hypothetical protein